MKQCHWLKSFSFMIQRLNIPKKRFLAKCLSRIKLKIKNQKNLITKLSKKFKTNLCRFGPS